MKPQIIVIYGGKSAEHDISLKSAMSVINAIDRNEFEVIAVYISKEGVWRHIGTISRTIEDEGELVCDPSNPADLPSSIGNTIAQLFKHANVRAVFPVIHGTNGEDGTLQGLLELLNAAYVGCGVAASAAGMDKVMTKQIMRAAGIPQADFLSFRASEWHSRQDSCLEAVAKTIGYPCYVKPANSGSSIGISRCEHPQHLRLAAETAFRYDRCIVIEQEIAGREVQVGVMGNDEPKCSVAGEFVREPSFFGYEQKYLQGKLVQRIPAQLTEDEHTQIREYAIRAFRALNGSGLMRVDFFVAEHGGIYLNEVNTLPGFTLNSMFPALWNRTEGLTYPQLIRQLIQYALERHELKQSICYKPDADQASMGGKTS
jgi:D-alanine-D-alanine ligase